MKPSRFALPLTLLTLCLIAGCGDTPPDSQTKGKSETNTDPQGNPTQHTGDELEIGDADFTPITLDDCEVFMVDDSATDLSEAVWSETADGVIQCTGSPLGYLYTVDTYDDFVLEVEYRFITPEDESEWEKPELANTGFLIYVPDEHKKWPRSPEVQGRWDEMANIKSNGRDLTVEVIKDDEDARQSARKPVGQWNTIRIISQNGALKSELNGVKICETKPCELKSGHIGLQAEKFPVEFRNLRVHRLTE